MATKHTANEAEGVMLIFICARCREICDSDDGYEEVSSTELVCVPCFDQLTDDEMRAALSKADGV